MGCCSYNYLLCILILSIAHVNSVEYEVGPFTIPIESRVSLTWSINADQITFQLFVKTNGWIAIGFSKNEGKSYMIDSDAYVGYTLQGQQVVTDYYISNREVICPGICTDVDQGGRNDVESHKVTQQNGVTTMEFTRKLVTGDPTDYDIIKGDMILIYAFSSNGDTHIQYHSSKNRGALSVNFFTGKYKELSKTSMTNALFIAHGIIMFTVWNIITPVSVLIARYLKPKRKAIRIHKYFQQFVILGSIPSFVVALYAVKVHYQSTHAILGLCFLILTSIQGSLGTVMSFVLPFWNDPIEKRIFKDKVYKFPRKLRKYSEKVHPLLGKLLFFASFVLVYTGMKTLSEHSRKFEIVFWIWFGILMAFVIFREVQLRVFKTRQRNKIADVSTSSQMEQNKQSLFSGLLVQSMSHIGVDDTRSLKKMSNEATSSFQNIVLPDIMKKELQHSPSQMSEPEIKIGTSHGKKIMKILKVWVTYMNVQIFIFVAFTVVILGSGIWGLVTSILSSDLSSPSIGPNLRTYYIQAEEILWDYAPLDYNVVKNRNWTSQELFYVSQTNPDFIGKKYYKAVYREYKDENFTIPVQQPESHGLFGPLLRAEVGDTIMIYFKNNLPFNATMHPHGVFYAKSDEGVHYNDGTPKMKVSDAVAPGQTYTYVWPVPERSGPTHEEGSSTLWLYHSHYMEHEHINAGLVGGIIISKKGMFNSTTKMPTDVDREFVVLFSKLDESTSIFFEKNLNEFVVNASNVNHFDPIIIDHNTKRTINGYMFGNLPPFTMKKNERVRWYISSIGSFMDVHTPVWQEQSVLNLFKHRVSTVNIFPTSMEVLDLIPDKPGTFTFECKVSDHIQNGMQTLFKVEDVVDENSNSQNQYSNGKIRNYFIAAEEVIWNYLPLKKNAVTNSTSFSFTEQIYVTNTNIFIGSEYKKARYVFYTDNTFSVRANVSEDWKHLGLLPPPIRAQVGDTIVITMKNTLTFPISLQTLALPSNVSASSRRLSPGQIKSFYYFVPERCGPSDYDPSSTFWLYNSYEAGLTGVILITKKDHSTSESSLVPKGIDKEYILMYSIMDENTSPYLAYNIKTYANDSKPDLSNVMDPIAESNRKYSINGYLFGNLPSINMKVNDKVRWYTFTQGNEADVHAVRFHGQPVIRQNHRVDSLLLLPATLEIADMVPSKSGTFEVDCGSMNHHAGGATALYHVEGVVANNITVYVTVHEHYIAAVEELWDYAPLGYNYISNKSFHGMYEESWAKGGINTYTGPTVGSIYKKSHYYEYTDSTFTTLKPVPKEWKHKGSVGPVLKGEVGDLIIVHFKNLATLPYNMEALGVRLVNQTINGGVLPNQICTYVWHVSDECGPADNDVSSLSWLYRSTVNERADTSAGLMGLIIVTKKGMFNSTTGRPTDVDREFISSYVTTYEFVSHYFMDSVVNAGIDPSNFTWFSSLDWISTNIKPHINGYMFGNNPHHIVMYQGERVRWYVFVVGDAAETHTAHWHAVTLIYNGKRLDVLTVQPSQMTSVDMLTDNPGTWLMHCHINAHLSVGMTGLFTIMAQ